MVLSVMVHIEVKNQQLCLYRLLTKGKHIFFRACMITEHPSSMPHLLQVTTTPERARFISWFYSSAQVSVITIAEKLTLIVKTHQGQSNILFISLIQMP